MTSPSRLIRELQKSRQVTALLLDTIARGAVFSRRASVRESANQDRESDTSVCGQDLRNLLAQLTETTKAGKAEVSLCHNERSLRLCHPSVSKQIQEWYPPRNASAPVSYCTNRGARNGCGVAVSK